MSTPTVTVSSGSSAPPPPPAPPVPSVPGVTLPSVHPPPLPGRGGGGGPSGGGSQGSGGSSGRARVAQVRAAAGRVAAARLGRARSRLPAPSRARLDLPEGPHRHRRTTLVFVLRRPALVESWSSRSRPHVGASDFPRPEPQRREPHQARRPSRTSPARPGHLPDRGAARAGGKSSTRRLVVVQNARRANSGRPGTRTRARQGRPRLVPRPRPRKARAGHSQAEGRRPA